MAFNWETVVQIVLLILALRLLHMVTAADSCSEVRRNFVAKRIGQMKLVPYNAFEAKNLRVCPNAGLTCCTRAMENRFQLAAKSDVEKVLKYKTSSLKFNFRSFSERFQDDVVEVFSLARNSTRRALHHALRKKVPSQTNKAVMEEVDRLFDDLGLQSTQEEVITAFDRFTDKLFLILLDGAGNTTADSDYVKCISRQRVNLHPFMDVPTITAANLTSALRLAQTLHETLAAGAYAVNVTQATALTKSCQTALLKMQYCSHCFGLTLLKPCVGLCRNVLRGCFAGVTELDQYWNYYVEALVDISEQMRSSESKYNLEVALEDFQNKMSSSLSIILENITTMRETVEEGCKNGKGPNRSKRSADFPQPKLDAGDDSDDDMAKERKNGGKRRKQGRRNSSRMERLRTKELSRLKEELPPKKGELVPRHKVRPPHEMLFNASPNKLSPRSKSSQQIVHQRKTNSDLNVRIKRFITSLNLSVNFYRHLPDDMCTSRMGTIEVVNHGKCWDGSNIVEEYPKDVVPTGYGKQAANPEVKVLKVEKAVIRAIEKLRLATKLLLLTSGKREVPGILLHAPVYERRVDEEEKEETPSVWPCDDEDCESEGSADADVEPQVDGGRKRKHPEPPISPYDPPVQKPSDGEDIEILIGQSRYNKTTRIDVTIGKAKGNREPGGGRFNDVAGEGLPEKNKADTGKSQGSTTEDPGNSAAAYRFTPSTLYILLTTRFIAAVLKGA